VRCETPSATTDDFQNLERATTENSPRTQLSLALPNFANLQARFFEVDQCLRKEIG
jgi:hypothetical protein